MHAFVRTVGFYCSSKAGVQRRAMVHRRLVPVVQDARQTEHADDPQDEHELKVAKPMEPVHVYSTVSEAVQCPWEQE